MARPYGRSHVCWTERREMPNLKVVDPTARRPRQPGFSREQRIATMTSGALSSIVGPCFGSADRVPTQDFEAFQQDPNPVRGQEAKSLSQTGSNLRPDVISGLHTLVRQPDP